MGHFPINFGICLVKFYLCLVKIVRYTVLVISADVLTDFPHTIGLAIILNFAHALTIIHSSISLVLYLHHFFSPTEFFSSLLWLRHHLLVCLGPSFCPEYSSSGLSGGSAQKKLQEETETRKDLYQLRKWEQAKAVFSFSPSQSLYSLQENLDKE